MSRRFGNISTNIWTSRRIRRLSGPVPRLVYLYLHTTPLGNQFGCFQLISAAVARDIGVDLAEVDIAVSELNEVGLISWDPDEEVVAIRRFFRQNGPTSRKNAHVGLEELQRLPLCRPSIEQAVDYMASLWSVSRKWQRDLEAGRVAAGAKVASVQEAIVSLHGTIGQILEVIRGEVDPSVFRDPGVVDLDLKAIDFFVADIEQIGLLIGLPIGLSIGLSHQNQDQNQNQDQDQDQNQEQNQDQDQRRKAVGVGAAARSPLGRNRN